eukprot:GDKH01016742.1.p3 GENE.GDKH01016742.1~~GDKH01016742.1.p3  ORF type:complete len:60 (-),score=3.74 GDKH01016742.1:74-253(-)
MSQLMVMICSTSSSLTNHPHLDYLPLPLTVEDVYLSPLKSHEGLQILPSCGVTPTPLRI